MKGGCGEGVTSAITGFGHFAELAPLRITTVAMSVLRVLRSDNAFSFGSVTANGKNEACDWLSVSEEALRLG